MDAQTVEKLFTRSGGDYAFARLSLIKGAVEAVCQLAGHEMVELDPELGANFMWFFLEDWRELLEVPNLDRLIPELAPLVERLVAGDANQYRIFRFDDAGGIQACFVFLRMNDDLKSVSAETLALSQVVQSILLWSDLAFRDRSPLAVANGTTVLRPDIAEVIRAAYDPVMPLAAQDASHALRLAAPWHINSP